MKVKEYLDLIENAKKIKDRVRSITKRSDFRLNNDYSVSGYTLEDIENYIDKTVSIIEDMEAK